MTNTLVGCQNFFNQLSFFIDTDFYKHGMQNIGYWVPTDKENTLVYIIAHKSKESAAKSWQAFISDEAWKKVYGESIANGKLVEKIDSVFMTATDYSKIN